MYNIINITNKMVDILIATIHLYEQRFDLDSKERLQTHESLDQQIMNFLSIWVVSMPKAAKRLYGKSLDRAIHFITNHHFIIKSVFRNGPEVTINYINKGSLLYQISITPHKVLLLDVELGKKEAAFPTEWETVDFN
jgi:hypothetical protein